MIGLGIGFATPVEVSLTRTPALTGPVDLTCLSLPNVLTVGMVDSAVWGSLMMGDVDSFVDGVLGEVRRQAIPR